MTREEAIEILKGAIKKPNTKDGYLGQALDMAIKALEQESCGDAISRQETIEAFQMFRGYEANRTNAEWVDRIETVVKKLPSVNPQPKTGHWMKQNLGYKCSNCTLCTNEKGHLTYNYCPNCGACMKDGRTLDEFIEDSKESEK